MAGPTARTASPGTSGKPRFDKTLVVVIMVVVVVAGVVAVTATALFIGQSSVTTKNFTPYSTPPPQSNAPVQELTVLDTNGDINLQGWSQANILINGTVTARGLGANPDAITFIESNSSGDIVFQAVFPPSAPFFSPSYTVNINVYLPSSSNLQSVEAVTANGNIQVSSINAPSSAVFGVTNGKLSVTDVATSDLALTNTNGDIYISCTACYRVTATSTNGAIDATFDSLSYTGYYTLTSTNGNIDLKVPSTGSFKITPNTTNGSVTYSGLSLQITNHVTTVFGAGTATVTATTTNGQIQVGGL
jgi:Putative adhesin